MKYNLSAIRKVEVYLQRTGMTLYCILTGSQKYYRITKMKPVHGSVSVYGADGLDANVSGYQFTILPSVIDETRWVFRDSETFWNKVHEGDTKGE